VEAATLLIKRPILVWVIFVYSVYVAITAALAAWRIAMAPTGTPSEYGPGGLVVSLVPAAVLFFSGLSLFMLTRWAVWIFALNAVIVASVIYTSPSIETVAWIAIALLVLAYTMWLRRTGILR
jgi:hypothetical protein